MKYFLLGLALLLAAGQLHAESRYVTDQFKVTLRSGESSTHKILRMLPSGYEVQLLESNAASGYSHVRTQDGKTGYILTRQLMPIPSARDRLVSAESRLRELLEEPGKLTARLAKLQEEFSELQQEHSTLSQQKEALDKELESIRRTASNAIRISNERNELRKQVAELTREIEDVKQQNRELENKTAQNWFLIGAGVVVGGILLGLILPHLRVRRRKSSWGSL